MSKLRLATGAILTVAALVLVPAPGASAHVHGITPLRCTPAATNAGANQTNETAAAAVNGGPISGVIPITMGGNVTLFGEGFDAAVCSQAAWEKGGRVGIFGAATAALTRH